MAVPGPDRTNIVYVMHSKHCNTLDMEPPDDSISNGSVTVHSDSIEQYIVKSLDTTFPKVEFISIRLRGGMMANTLQKDVYDVPSLTKSNFKWNGYPSFDFVETIRFPLEAGLGTVSYKDATLLARAKDRDPGGNFGIPNALAAPPNIQQEKVVRDERLFFTICNYLEPNCHIYRVLMRDFNGSGMAAFNFVIANGLLALPPKERKKRENEWDDLTMQNQHCAYSMDGYFKWLYNVVERGQKLGKPQADVKTKFIDGLPDQFFSAQKLSMRSDATMVFPATYGALPIWSPYPAAMGANPHPAAGAPFPERLARAYVTEWYTAIQGIAPTPPRGMVREVIEIDTVNMIGSKEIQEAKGQVKCFKCGGFWHTARCQLSNGDIAICAATQVERDLGIKIDPPENINSGTGTPSDKYKKKYLSAKVTTEEQVAEIGQLRDMVAKLNTELATTGDISSDNVTSDDGVDDASDDGNTSISDAGSEHTDLVNVLQKRTNSFKKRPSKK